MDTPDGGIASIAVWHCEPHSWYGPVLRVPCVVLRETQKTVRILCWKRTGIPAERSVRPGSLSFDPTDEELSIVLGFLGSTGGPAA